MKRIKVTLDGVFECEEFSCYTKGEHWNGFAVPYFTRGQADYLMLSLNMTNDIGIRYNETKDSYTVSDILSGTVDEYFSTYIDGKVYYPIGSFGWAWIEC